uniref:Uncharacterized protein n=2 Tax=Meloidogyne incognita group TaxID=654580 RepID=A0A915LHA0_MELJA
MRSPRILVNHNELGPHAEIDAFIRQWIVRDHLENTGAVFRPEFWNVSYRVNEDLARTSNGIESWHNVFNSNFSNGHPKLSYFVRMMENE